MYGRLVLPGGPYPRPEHWILRCVNFAVHRYEFVGKIRARGQYRTSEMEHYWEQYEHRNGFGIVSMILSSHQGGFCPGIDLEKHTCITASSRGR